MTKSLEALETGRNGSKRWAAAAAAAAAANAATSVGDAIEHICGVVGVIGVLGVLLGVDTRILVGFSSLPLNSRERFGTRPYLTANKLFKVEIERTTTVNKVK